MRTEEEITKAIDQYADMVKKNMFYSDETAM